MASPLDESGSTTQPLVESRSSVNRDDAPSRSSRLSAHDRASLVTHGDWKTFLFDSFALMFGGTQLGYAMGQMGLIDPMMRLPLTPLSETRWGTLNKAIDECTK